jgi:hypothetical protein
MNNVLFPLILACAIVLGASIVSGQTAPVQNVSFTLAVIRASGTEGEEEIDDDLTDIKDALVATGYKKFTLESSAPYSYPHMTQVGAKLPEGYHLTMVVQTDGTNQAVRAVITHDSDKKKIILDTTIPLSKNKPVLVTGPALKEGVLILCFIGR